MKKVINLYYIIFIYYLIELCCSFCHFKNLHPQHKLLEINDEEALKKENITINDSTKEFDANIQKLNELKNSLEHEMQEIDKSYEKTDKETTKFFEKKREKLNKEEEDLKEKLKIEVTKIKEKLENYLSQTYNLTKICERIIKGVKSIQNEETNMIKILSYVSFINKNQKEIDVLTKELIKNLKITFNEEEGTIKYEEYYFNGFPIPKDIEFKEIESTNLKVLWKLDDINLLNIDKNQIQYIIEIRKENEQNFKKIYEGKDQNYLINNLEEITNYEIRICSLYKESRSNWSKFKTFTTKMNSLILNKSERRKEFLEKLYEWTGYKKMELLYRGTRDGSKSKNFHNKCDNQGPTICLCENEKGNIFGGYSSISWESSGGNKSANGSFLFTLTNMYDTAPTKYPNTQNYDWAVYHDKGYGPIFGGNNDLRINNYFDDNQSYCKLGYSYPDTLGKGNSVFSGDVNTNYFKLKEFEVFKMFN